MFTARARRRVARNAIAVLNSGSFNRTIRIISFLINMGLMMFQAISGTRRINVLLGNSQFARIARLQALSISAFAILCSAIRLTRHSGQSIRLLNRSLRQAQGNTSLFLATSRQRATNVRRLRMISSSSFRPVLACRAAYLDSRFRRKREEHIIRMGQYIMRFFCLMIRLSPLMEYRLATLSFLTQGFTSIRSRAICRLRITRFGQGRNCKRFTIRHRVLNRKGRRNHLARNQADHGSGRIKILPAKNRLIRLVRSTQGPARAINAYHHLLRRLMNLLGSQVGLHVVLLRILLESFRRLSFYLLRRIIRILHLIRHLDLCITHGEGRLAYRGLLNGSANVMLGIDQQNRLAARLDSVRQSTHLFRIATQTRLLNRNRSVGQFLLGDRIDGNHVGRLIPIFMRQLQAGGLTRRQVHVLLGRRHARRDFFRFKDLELRITMLVRQLNLDHLYRAYVSSQFYRFIFIWIKRECSFFHRSQFSQGFLLCLEGRGAGSLVVAFPGTGVGLNLGVVRGHPSNCRGLRAVFCPVRLRSTLRMAQERGGSTPCALRIGNATVRNGPRSGLIIETCRLLGGSRSVPSISVRLFGRVPANTKLKNNSSSYTFVVGLLGRGFHLTLDLRRVRSCTTHLKTSYTFFVHGRPMFTANVNGVFRPIHLSLSNCCLILIGPSVFMSAHSTFTRVAPHHPRISLGSVVYRPMRA